MFEDIFSHVDTIHQRDRQTDRQTPDDSKSDYTLTAAESSRSVMTCSL